MAGPNLTGDKDNIEEEQELATEQEATLPPTEATITDTVIADSDSDMEKEFKLEQAHIEEELNAAQEAEGSVMVGRDKNNIGENATSNATLDATIAITPGANAQDITNDETPVESIFTASPHSNQVALDQIGKGQQGIEGSIAGVMGVTDTATMERKRKERDSLANIRAITMTAEVAAAYAAIEEALQDMGIELTDLTDVFAEIDAQASEMLDSLGKQANAVETNIADLKQELQDMRGGKDLLFTDTAPEMKAAQITLKEAEIANAEARLELINNTMTATRDQIQETKDKIETAQEKYDHLREQESLAKITDPNNNLANIQAQMVLAKSDVDTARASIEKLKDQAKITESISKLVGVLEGVNHGCGITPEVELNKAAEINARTALIETLTAATADGDIDETELAAITSGLNTAGISQDAKNEFINSFAATNGTITLIDSSSPTGERVLTGDDITAYLQTQWAEIQEEKQDATEASIDHAALGDALKLELAASEAQTAQLQSNVTEAQETVTHEQAESDTATAGAIDIKEMTLQYDSVYDYMSENYSVTIAFIDFGKGENIDDVANDSTRALRDEGGNLVYVDPDTQRMYTLQKDDNGNVARDTDGNQIHVAVSSLETIELYQDMYAKKLLPRNFFRDEGGVYKEYSEADSFAEGIGKSILPGWMGNNQREEIIAEAEAEEKQDAVDAKAAASEANTALSTAQDDLSNKENTLNTHNAKTEDIRARMNAAYLAAEKFEANNAAIVAANAKDAPPVETVADNNTETTEDTAETTATEKTDNASDTQWETSETHKLDVPEHSLSAAEASHNAALEKVEMAVRSGGTLSQEDYDTLKDAPGMSAEQLDDMMAQNKVTLNDGNAPEVANNAVNTPTNTMTVQHTAGIQFDYVPIQIPTAPAPDQNGISPAIKYESFADSMEFSSTNDPSSTTNSYDAVAVKQGEDPPAATSMFAAAQLETPDGSGDSAPKVNGLTPAQVDQLRIQEENNRQAAQLAALATQGAGAGAGGGSSGGG